MRIHSIEVGERIYLARKRRNMKQSEVCQILNISQSAYSNIETGKTDITINTLSTLSEIFGVHPFALLTSDYTDLRPDEILELENYKRYIISKRK